MPADAKPQPARAARTVEDTVDDTGVSPTRSRPQPGRAKVVPPPGARRAGDQPQAAHPRAAPASQPDADVLLTVAELCAWFRVPAGWVYDEVQAGRLPFIRLGRQTLRFRRADLRRFLAEHTGQPTTRTAPPRRGRGDLEPLD